MSRKKIAKQSLARNRLENLFVDLEQDASLMPASGEASLPGWTWECDALGNYTACGLEVENVLGWKPDEILGQSLAGRPLQAAGARERSRAGR